MTGERTRTALLDALGAAAPGVPQKSPTAFVYVIALNERMARHYARIAELKHWRYLGSPEAMRGKRDIDIVLYGNWADRRDAIEFSDEIDWGERRCGFKVRRVAEYD